MMLKYLIEKEFKQFRRNPFLPKLVIGMPLMMMLVLPWAIDPGTKNVNFMVVDSDNSTYSRRFADKIAASEYFNYAGAESSYSDAMEHVEKGSVDLILEISAGFERDLATGVPVPVMISANSVNGTKGMLGSSYLAMIAASFSEELRGENPSLNATVFVPPVIEIVPRSLFNPEMDYKVFMIPGLMVLLLTL